MPKKMLILLLTILYSGMARAQDYSFTQYFLDKLSLSPAFAAVGDYSEAGCAARSQWPAMGGGCRIYMAEYQQKLPSISSGCAARLSGNTQGGGAYSTATASAIYACEINLSDNIKCSMGLEAGYAARSLRQDGLVYYSMLAQAQGGAAPLDESVPKEKCSTIFFSAGAALYTRRTLLGAGLQRLARIDMGQGCFAGMGIALIADHKFVIDGDPEKERQFLAPCVTITITPYSSTVMPGIYYQGSKITASLALRSAICSGESENSISAYAGYSFGRLEIGLGHDFEISPSLRRSGGATEACIKYKIKKY